jgi:hypothetical protein
MKVFCQRNEDYLNLIKQENTVAPETPTKENSENGEANIEEEYESSSTKLKAHELEREILNIRTLLSHVFIPKILTIEPREVILRETNITL